MQKVFRLVCFFYCIGSLGCVSIWAGEAAPALVIDSTEMESAQTIDDITGTGYVLPEEPFRPQGTKMSLRLQDAIDIAMKSNPQLRISGSSLNQSMANLDLTLSDYRSKFDLTSGFTESLDKQKIELYGNNDTYLGSRSNSNNTEMFYLGPKYRQTFQNGSSISVAPQFNFNHSPNALYKGKHEQDKYQVKATYDYPINSRPAKEIRTRVENQKLTTIQSDYDLYINKKSITEQVINAYWRIKQYQENVAIQNERLLQARKIEFIITTQYKYDQASKVQVGQAQVDVLNNEAGLIQTEGGLRSSIESFNQTLGLPIETELILTDEVEVSPLPMSASEYIAFVTGTNLELKRARLGIRQTENSLKVARLGQQPDLTWSNLLSEDDDGNENLTTALIFSWPFGDGGRTKANIRILQERLLQQKINLEELERTLIRESYSDLRNLQLELQRMEILKRNVDQAYINLDNALFNFQQFGRITVRDMQFYQNDLSNSRTQLISSRVSYNIAKSSLMQKVHDYQPSESVKPLMGLLK